MHLWIAPSFAGTSEPELRAHIKRAEIFYQQRDYQAALVETQAAYAMRPLPRLLLNIGHLQRKLGQSDEARQSYERYLAIEPHPTAEVERDLRAYMASTKQPESEAEPQPTTAPRPMWRMVTGGIGAALGLGLTGFGAAALAVDGRCTQEGAIGPQCPFAAGASGRDVTSVYDTRNMGIALVVSGGALMVAGIALSAAPGRRRMEKVVH